MTNTPAVSRGTERAVLGLFAAAAAVIGLSLMIPPVRQIVQLVSGEATVDLLTTAEVPHTTMDSGVKIVSATFQSAWVTATGLSDAAQWMIGLSIGFAALTAAAVAGAAVYFALLLMWKRPFHRSLVVATQIAGATLMIGSLLSGGLGGLGRMMAADELNPLVGDVFLIGFEVDVTPILAGLAVLALSFVFDRGAKLQHDTDGLV